MCKRLFFIAYLLSCRILLGRHTLVVMNTWITALILGLSLSADALASGFAAGASRLRVPLHSAVAAATVSAAFVAVGMATGNVSALFLPEVVKKYLSFFVLAVFGLIKLAGAGSSFPTADKNRDRNLSVSEGVSLGAALSVDGLAAGFGVMATAGMVICATAFTFLFTAAALYLGAKGGSGMKSGRWGNVAAGLALIILAVQKIV